MHGARIAMQRRNGEAKTFCTCKGFRGVGDTIINVLNNKSNAKLSKLPLFVDYKDDLDSWLLRFERFAETVSFERRHGVVFRIYKDDKQGGAIILQVVLPQSLRKYVMSVAHDSIAGGHQVSRKTKDKIITSFYWPRVEGDVARYCRSCDVCPKTINKGAIPKAPLQRIPVVDVPFKRVAVDLVGPIDLTSEDWHRYILTLVDYATGYPEAVPLKRIDAETVAEAKVRGPMHILKRLWTKDIEEDEVKSIYQYVLELRERLQRT
ncbi:hypothetical protein EGW08_006487 [Elysia chlorotica]|uniref:Integrase zinc-binding domain-containing protein n=1 Tax=Elysia chlorotica TaxID=188477 RepID=A0A433TW24_ELYCH|nr:hypothetical protein EGW08_006487 [Elysia chlorotica]